MKVQLALKSTFQYFLLSQNQKLLGKIGVLVAIFILLLVDQMELLNEFSNLIASLFQFKRKTFTTAPENRLEGYEVEYTWKIVWHFRERRGKEMSKNYIPTLPEPSNPAEAKRLQDHL